MYELELILLLFFGFVTFHFLYKWYRTLALAWPPERIKVTRRIFHCLPLAALIMIIYTLKVLASFDVVGDILYILFYIAFGFAWLQAGLFFVFSFFDISWREDALHNHNPAAVAAIIGGFLGITCIYCGANIGDGPGWWCVLLAGGLGMASWFLLGVLANLMCGVPERITIDRDFGCGIRFGAYLLASGILLGRASAGDWTSAAATIYEFKDGWPVLLLFLLLVLVDRIYSYRSVSQNSYIDGDGPNPCLPSVIWGIVFIAFAVIAVIMLPPLPQNPMYAGVSSLNLF